MMWRNGVWIREMCNSSSIMHFVRSQDRSSLIRADMYTGPQSTVGRRLFDINYMCQCKVNSEAMVTCISFVCPYITIRASYVFRTECIESVRSVRPTGTNERVVRTHTRPRASIQCQQRQPPLGLLGFLQPHPVSVLVLFLSLRRLLPLPLYLLFSNL